MSLEPDEQTLSDQYAWLDGGQDFVVCAFYTPNYEAYAHELRHSLEVLGINHFLKGYASTNSWEAATRLKPAFIAECLAKLEPLHVLYVDADAIVLHPLDLLDKISTDVALSFEAERKHEERPQLRVVPGTIYVRSTPGGRRFVEAWRNVERDLGPRATDSVMLRIALARLQGLTITVLPGTYAKGDPSSEQVIQHLRASRRNFLGNRRRTYRRRRQLAVIAVTLAALVSGAAYLYFSG